MEKVLENQNVKTNGKTRSHAKQIATDAMFVALTLVFTAFVNIQIPSFGGAGGLIHLGNVPLFVAAMIYGKRTGALAGALGMGLFDILSGLGGMGTLYHYYLWVNGICSRGNLQE